MEALKNIAYILNNVSSKSVPETPYGLWIKRNTSLNYLHVLGYLAEAKVFYPKNGKLEPKAISFHFISYLEISKGYLKVA